jgi:hypothetical protein
MSTNENEVFQPMLRAASNIFKSKRFLQLIQLGSNKLLTNERIILIVSADFLICETRSMGKDLQTALSLLTKADRQVQTNECEASLIHLLCDIVTICANEVRDNEHSDLVDRLCDMLKELVPQTSSSTISKAIVLIIDALYTCTSKSLPLQRIRSKKMLPMLVKISETTDKETSNAVCRLLSALISDEDMRGTKEQKELLKLLHIMVKSIKLAVDDNENLNERSLHDGLQGVKSEWRYVL